MEGAHGSFGWRVGAIRRDAGDLETPEGELPNTDYEQTNGSAAVGLSGNWGSWQLRWQSWNNDVGFYFPPDDPRSRFRLDLGDDSYNTELTLPTGAGELNVLLSRQQNTRKAQPFPDLPPPVDLELRTDIARVGLSHERVGAFQGRLAFEYQGLRNETFGPATLVPEYDGDNLAWVVFEEGRFLPARKADHERLIVSFGLRFDRANLRVPAGASALVPAGGFDRVYESPTGSVGLVYRFTEQFSLAASAGRGWRPPSAFELFADGDHVGVGAYQLGNPALVEESNLSAELSARYQSRHLRGVFTAYRSDFHDYIYLRDVTGDPDLPPGLPEPVFSYGQTDAVIDGIELSFDAVPIEILQIGLLYSQVDTENETTGTHLPQTPPNRIGLSAGLSTAQFKALVDPYVELEWTWVDNGVPSGPDEPYFESGNAATASYELGNLRAGFKLNTKAGIVGLDLTVRNLLDTTYTDFLYPYKVWGVPNPGRDVRLLTRFVF
jgi:outer membrane receptor protein involved in Fe transport